jgi:hypothetical protein
MKFSEPGTTVKKTHNGSLPYLLITTLTGRHYKVTYRTSTVPRIEKMNTSPAVPSLKETPRFITDVNFY